MDGLTVLREILVYEAVSWGELSHFMAFCKC